MAFYLHKYIKQNKNIGFRPKYLGKGADFLLSVKCFIGQKEFQRVQLKNITVDDKIINKIVNDVNLRSGIKSEKKINE